ncbi:MAG: hypothetical protein P1V97_01715 [Planctomycetota bacterium]|nr:hypothetical protein [Planctomycetota bacterium]
MNPLKPLSLLLVLVLSGCFNQYDTVEKIDIKPYKPKSELFIDDKIEDKKPIFDPTLVDSRLVKTPNGDWEVNTSAAVLKLDVPDIKGEAGFDKLYPSYTEAAKAFLSQNLLPSINLLDGKSKQFDDGLYGAVDSAVAFSAKSPIQVASLLSKLRAKCTPKSKLHDWLTGALDVGKLLSEDESRAKSAGAQQYVDAFLQNAASKPVGFYNWSPELQRTFQMLRYLMTPLDKGGERVLSLKTQLTGDKALYAQYKKVMAFYSRLSNPFKNVSLEAHFSSAAKDRVYSSVYFLPGSTSREVELIEKLYGNTGLSPSVNLMNAFVKAIREGTVDLQPSANSGWYDYQVHALETFLLPEKGAENNKLLLTKRYKLRMLEAFKALITKRRETHIRQMSDAKTTSARIRPEGLSPRLRVEPNPTYFLRTARSYSFLEGMLTSSLGKEFLSNHKGLKKGGTRPLSLAKELKWMKQFFYGLHLISCEDIGLKNSLLKNELKDKQACEDTAKEWLGQWTKDVDLSMDTRVVVPVARDTETRRMRLWSTIGVRGVKLTAWYVTAPKWRPVDEKGKWIDLERYQMQSAQYVILTDDFAEYEIGGFSPPTREEFRRR